MSETVREDLLGYLLNAVDEETHDRVAGALATDESLRDDLDRVSRHLQLLSTDRNHHDPPPALALRTCASIWVLAARSPGSSEGGIPSPTLEDQLLSRDGSPSQNEQNSSQNETPLSTTVAAVLADSAQQVCPSEMSVEPLSVVNERVASRSFSVADLLVAAGIVMLAGFLVFPALSHSRSRTRLAACQNNLGQLGLALHSYSDLYRGFLPQLSVNGPRAFAGVFGPTLRDGLFLTSNQVLDCPGGGARGTLASTAPVTLAQLDSAFGSSLKELQQRAGGDYAYLIGHVLRNQYHGPRNRNRAHFPMLADAPTIPVHDSVLAQSHFENAASVDTLHSPSGPTVASPFPLTQRSRLRRGMEASWKKLFASDHHDGHGQNLLFEDGHFQHVSMPEKESLADHPYVNRHGMLAPGADEEDAVLASSETTLELPADLSSR